MWPLPADVVWLCEAVNGSVYTNSVHIRKNDNLIQELEVLTESAAMHHSQSEGLLWHHLLKTLS